MYNWINWAIGIAIVATYTLGMGMLIYVKLQKKKKQTFNDLEIRFHKEANPFGEHGMLNVTHVKYGLTEQTIRFVIVGLTTPPQLNKEIFNFIWEEAKNQGYVPHHFVTYGRENEIINSLPVKNTDTEYASAMSFSLAPVDIATVASSQNKVVPHTKAGPMSMVYGQKRGE